MWTKTSACQLKRQNEKKTVTANYQATFTTTKTTYTMLSKKAGHISSNNSLRHWMILSNNSKPNLLFSILFIVLLVLFFL